MDVYRRRRALQRGRVRLVVVLAVALVGLAATAAFAADPLFKPVPKNSLKGKTIGYVNATGDPFIEATNAGVKKAVETAGAKFKFCAAKDVASQLTCWKTFGAAKVDAVIAFSFDPKATASYCKAVPKVPKIDLYIIGGGCFNSNVIGSGRAGFVAGKHLGEFAKSKFNCDIDAFVSLEAVSAGEANTLRMGGYRKGFESVCGPIPAEKFRQGAEASAPDAALTFMRNALQAFPGKSKIFVVSINDNGPVAALAAARQLGRENDVWASGQSASAEYLKNACNPHWVNDANYFPGGYGSIAVNTLVNIFKGRKVSKVIYMPVDLVTRENVNQIAPGTCP